MSILSGKAIVQAVEAGDIVIDPLNVAHVGPNSVDLTLDEVYTVEATDACLFHPLDKFIDPFDATTFRTVQAEWFVRGSQEVVHLRAGRLYLGRTLEVAGSPRRYVPCIEGRSSLARLGLHVHVSAGFGDVGYVNRWTLELVATLPITLYRGMRIAQIYFHEVVGEVEPYRGKYADLDVGPESRAHLDRESALARAGGT